MFALNAGRALAKRALMPRNMSTHSTPPHTRVSFAEKVAHGVFMTGCFMAIPTWVLIHIKEYRGQA